MSFERRLQPWEGREAGSARVCRMRNISLSCPLTKHRQFSQIPEVL